MKPIQAMAIGAVLCVTGAANASFTRIDTPHIFTTGMSADGQWITGYNRLDDSVFRYSTVTKTSQFISGPNTNQGLPDISNDGSKVTANIDNAQGVSVPSVWTDGVGWEEIAPTANAANVDNSTGFAHGISGDGATLTGFMWNTLPSGSHGYSSSGPVTAPLANSGAGGRGSRLSEDGSVIAGFDHDPVGGNGRRAAVWRNGALTVLTPNKPGDAEGINSDGTVAVGHGHFSAGEGAMKWEWDGANWTETNLGILPGSDPVNFAVSALDSNTAGDMIVGVNRSGSGPFAAADGFLWTPGTGMVNFEDYLTDLGIDFGNFDIQVLTSISDDGTIISGWGTNLDTFNQEGFWVQIPASGTAPLLAIGAIAFTRRRRISNQS